MIPRLRRLLTVAAARDWCWKIRDRRFLNALDVATECADSPNVRRLLHASGWLHNVMHTGEAYTLGMACCQPDIEDGWVTTMVVLGCNKCRATHNRMMPDFPTTPIPTNRDIKTLASAWYDSQDPVNLADAIEEVSGIVIWRRLVYRGYWVVDQILDHPT